MKTAELEVLEAIIFNTNMSMHSFDVLFENKKLKDSELLAEMREQYEDYHAINEQAASLVQESGNEVKQQGAMAKTMSKMGIKMNTMLDSSASHIADMLIQGSTMGITEITRELNAKGGNIDKTVSELADKLLHAEQKNIDRMRNYL